MGILTIAVATVPAVEADVADLREVVVNEEAGTRAIGVHAAMTEVLGAIAVTHQAAGSRAFARARRTKPEPIRMPGHIEARVRRAPTRMSALAPLLSVSGFCRSSRRWWGLCARRREPNGPIRCLILRHC